MNKSNLDGPMVDFGRFLMTFGNHFGIDFQLFFKNRKTLILTTLTWFGMFFSPKTSPFLVRFSLSFHVFIGTLQKEHF